MEWKIAQLASGGIRIRAADILSQIISKILKSEELSNIIFIFKNALNHNAVRLDKFLLKSLYGVDYECSPSDLRRMWKVTENNAKWKASF